MKQYKIYTNPQGTHEAVKQGWSWPAFFFGCIWAMVKKMWALGIGVLIACFIFGGVIGATMAGQNGEVLINVASLIVSIIFGFNGNNWREANLKDRGYDYKKNVIAVNPEGAIALYMK